jgi:GNAT superfamily N-acetyltransferase
MHWRVEKGGATWQACKGEPDRRSFLKLLKQGRAQGALAFAGGMPVGWCNFGPRADFPRLQRSRVLSYEAAPDTWSINCFFIAAGWRKRCIAGALLKSAIETAFARRARAGGLSHAAETGRDSRRRFRLDRNARAVRQSRLQAERRQRAGVGEEAQIAPRSELLSRRTSG